MINPINSSSVTPYATAQAPHSPSTAHQPANNPPEDTVHLSPQARSAGDVDHDGDAH